MYPFMTLPVNFIHLIRLTLKIYSSTCLHVHRCTVRQYTCSVYFFFFGITCTMTFQLVYWGTYTQIHPKVNLPVYPHPSLTSNHKDLTVSTTCVPAHRIRSTRQRFYGSTCTHMYLFITIPVQFISSFSVQPAH